MEALVANLSGQKHIVDRIFHFVHIVRVIRLEQVHTLIEQHPEIGRAQLVVAVVHAQPVAARIVGIKLAHVDAAADMLPLILVHLERIAHGVDVQFVAGGAIQIAIALQRGQKRRMRMIAGMGIDGAMIAGDHLLKPPGFAIILFGHGDVLRLADGRIIHARTDQNALEAQIHILDIGQKIAGVEIIGHGTSQLKGALIARITGVQKAKGDPGAGIVGVFLGVELIARDGHDEAVVILAGVDLRHDGIGHGAQLGIILPQERRAGARQELARRLTLEVDLEMAGLPGIRHRRRGLAGMDAVVIHHSIKIETLEERNVVFERPTQATARQTNAAHRRAGGIRDSILFAHNLFLLLIG